MARKDITQIYGENPKTYDQFTDQDYFYFATGGSDAATTLAELRKKMQGSASEAFSSTITADKNKNIGSYDLANGALTLNMAETGNIPGVVVTFKIIADGVNPVNLGAGFDPEGMAGIASGEVLPAGTYMVKLQHFASGAIIELPQKGSSSVTIADGSVTNSKLAVDVANRLAANDAKTSYTDGSTVASHSGSISNHSSRISNIESAIPGKADLVGGKVPSSQLPDISDSQYLGGWNASTNTPAVSDSVGTNGQFYIVDIGGTRNLGSGNKTFVAGGKAYYNGSIWEPKDPVDAVSSVQGRLGAVTVTKSDLGLSNVENKNSFQIRSEIVESNIPVSIARTSAIPTALSALSEDASNRRVSDSEKTSWNTAVSSAAAIPAKADKDNTIPDGELLQKKAGGNFEGTGKTINQILVKTGAVVTGTAIDYALGTTAADTLTANKTYTAINNMEHGVVWLIVTHAGFIPTFNTSLGTTVGTFTDYNGKYYIKITNFGSSSSKVLFFTDAFASGSTVTPPDVDTTAPIQSNESISGQTQTSFIFNVQSNEPGTIYAAAYSNASAGPSTISDILAGTGAISGTTVNKATTGGIIESLSISPLVNGTTYKIYYTIIDTAGNDTGVLGPVSGTTVVSDTTAPVFTNVSVINMTNAGGTFRGQIDEAGTIYIWVGANGATPASIAALKAGTGSIDFANTATGGGSLVSIAFDSLSASTAYDLWYCATDAAANDRAMVKIDITTVASGIPDSMTAVLKATTGLVFDYMKYLPNNYNASTYYPVIVSLHGLGETASSSSTSPKVLKVLEAGLPKALSLDEVNPDCIVVAPQHYTTGFWNSAADAAYLSALIDHVRNETAFGHKVNADKISMTGYSQGGSGTIYFCSDATRRAKLCAAVPMSTSLEDILSPDEWNNIHLWLFHGVADTNPPTPYSKSVTTFYTALQQSAPVSTPRITLFTGIGHSDTMWYGTFNGTRYDSAVTNTTYNSTAITSTVYNAASDLLTWILSKARSSADVTPPTLQTPTAGSQTTTQVTGTFQSNEAGLVYAAIYPTADSAHTKAEIQNGTGGALAYISGGKVLVANTNATHLFSGLTQGTNYKIHSWCNDNAGNESGIILSAQFSTQASDTTPPTISNVSVDTIAQTTCVGHAQINESGTIYVAVLPTASGTLTPAQIKAGTGNGIVAAGNTSTSGGSVVNINLSGLTAATAYKLQVMAEDTATNAVAAATVSSQFTTNAAASNKWLFAFRATGGSALPSGWNDVVGNPGSGALTFSNAIKSDGSASTVDIVKPSGGYASGSVNGGLVTGNNSGAYPDIPMTGYWFCGDDTGFWFNIEGLDASANYRARILANRDATGTRNTRFTITGQTAVTVNAVDNTTTPTAWVNFTSSAGGVINRLNFVRNTAGDQFAYLNVLELEKV
jgi:predicted esterase